MKAIFAKSESLVTDENAFRMEEIETPSPEGHDILVRISAIGMNPVDTKVRLRMENDTTLGWDACGVVESVGTAVSHFKPGDRVFYAGELTRPGTNSEYQLVDERIVGKAPEKLSDAQAAAMPLTSITAWEGLFDRLAFTAQANANTGKTLLVVGGAGGVGSIIIQLAKWAGITVIATASRPETVEWCKKLGAQHIINHRNNLADEIKAIGFETVDAIYCTTQMETHWEAMAECIRPQGHIVLIDDPTGPLDIRVFKFKCAAIHWEFMYTRSLFKTDDMDEQGKLLNRVAELLDSGDVQSTVQEELKGLTPDNIRAMHERQETGTMMGKQVLVL